MNSELLNLIENAPKVTLGDYIVRVERTNSAGAYGAEDVRGVSNTKGFMETRANIEGRSLKKFLVIEPFEFVFNRRRTIGAWVQYDRSRIYPHGGLRSLSCKARER